MYAEPLNALPSSGPRAWTRATLDAPDCWRYSLSPDGLSRLEAAARDLQRPLTEVQAPPDLREVLQDDLEPVRAALERGRGFAIIQGLDPTRHSEDHARAMYWLLGQGIGTPFAQNVQGTVLYDVKDTGQSVEYGARFSVTNADSSFHTDNSFGERVLDYVGLLCLQPARSGGINQIVSGFTAYAELARRSPDSLDVLRQPFHVDRRGGTREGEPPTVRMPVIQEREGEPLFRYLRYWIEVGHEKAGEPLASEQVRALDLLDETLSRPELRAEFTLGAGQIFLMNNRWTLHSRTAFEDYPEPERRRHLVRLWLQV